MDCRECASPLERPGDYCLVCNTENADVVGVLVEQTEATVTALLDDDMVSERVITTTPEDSKYEEAERRNFIGRVIDEVRRKRPTTLYVAGRPALVRSLNSRTRYETFSLGTDVDNMAAAIRNRERQHGLQIIQKQPADKIGGRHSSLIGDRDGKRAVYTVAGYPHVKKVIPGPIDGSGGSRDGFSAHISRVDETGNLRLILNDGSSVQTVRVVTTASSYEQGSRVKQQLEERLAG